MRATKILLAASLIVATAIGFTACGSDDDGDLGGASISETPAYESDAAKYDITSSGSYSSIELTASGNYIIQTKGTRATEQITSALCLFGHKTSVSVRSSDYSDGIYYGTFTKNGNTYILDGFGTLVINKTDDSTVSIEVTTEDGKTVSLVGKKVEAISTSTLTEQLCRTWRVVKSTQIFTDKKTGEVETLDLLAEDDIQDVYVIISKSGTYFSAVTFVEDSKVYTEYSSGTWRWVDESTGQVRLSECGDYDGTENYVDEHYFSISGNTFVVKSLYDDSTETYENCDYYVAL
jgi:hypothetical protein